MTRIIQKELQKLEHQLLTLSALVQENINNAVSAFQGRNAKLAAEVQNADQNIDQLEVEIEEECLKLLALYQPVASDLRYIIAALKINNDLERIGDLADNIAKTIPVMAENPKIEIPFDFASFTEETVNMLNQTIDAFINMDLEGARAILPMDDKIDEKNRQVQQVISRAIRRNPEQDIPYLQVLWVSRCLERIGDHATNIAEDIIYLLEGKIIRHQGKLSRKKPEVKE